MILLGHPLFDSLTLYHIDETDAIKRTPSNATLYLEYSENILDIIRHCQGNGISFALHVKSLKEVIFAYNFKARYIIVNENLAALAQKIADDYLFDAKILSHISNEDSIDSLATLGVDGVIFSEAIIKIS